MTTENTNFDTTQTTALLDSCREHLSPEALENLRNWLIRDAFTEFHAEIAARIQKGAWTELEDGFYTVLPFGTGGRRGPRGLGPNRINRRTMAESARGLANWVLLHGEEAKQRGIVIACDTRHGSAEFSAVCAQAIAATGVQVYLFDSFRPTPELSLAVRHLKAQAGIVVSASHNPPTDNGFKAYAADGGQLVPPDDAAVMSEVRKVALDPIPLMDLEEGKQTGRIKIVGKEIDEVYLDVLMSAMVTDSRKVRIVYSPLHGVGGVAVLPGLERAGFRDVHVVESQSFPSGDFPNVANQIPNPEVPSAMQQATELAQRLDADLALATDPDADRLGCVAKRVRDGQAEWMPLNGNQIGALICYSILSERHKQGRLPADGLVIRTAVTTALLDNIAAEFGVAIIRDLLVGFKYIACVINHLDDPNRFLFASEESHGYLSTPMVHDKDGANAALLLAEAAARVKEEGKDLWQLLEEIYRRFGYFSERLENYVRAGKTGQQEIMAMLERLRENPPRRLAGLDVVEIVDRQTDVVRGPDGRPLRPFEPLTDPKTKQIIAPLAVAKDNLLIFHLAGNADVDGAQVAVRPSGTEPKCKFYVAAHRRMAPTVSDEEFAEAKEAVNALTLALKDDIVRVAFE